MIDREKPAVIEAADKLNDVVEDLALKAAGAVGGGGDPEQIAGTTNEQIYLPEANELPSQGDSRSGERPPAEMGSRKPPQKKSLRRHHSFPPRSDSRRPRTSRPGR